MEMNLILLICLVLASLWTVMTVRIVRAVVGLALTSAILAIIIYRLGSPLAAVFELSVCSGLISAIFFVTISFTRTLTQEQVRITGKERLIKFGYLPIIVVLVGALLYHYIKPISITPLPVQEIDARYVLWNIRHLDLLGQIAALLAAAIGVVVLFKEHKK